VSARKVTKGRVLSVCVSERDYQTAYREARRTGIYVAKFLGGLVRAGLAQFDHDDPVGACVAWLRDLLTDGPLPATRVHREARARSFSERHLRAARDALRIERTRARGRRLPEYFWRLPSPQPEPLPVPPIEQTTAAPRAAGEE
jgi:hypothetical protein